MGSKNSKKQEIHREEYGDIFLDINKETFYPGEKISGNVYLYLKKSYPGNQLMIRLKGKEFVYFAEVKDRLIAGDKGYASYTHRQHKETTLQFSIPLFSWGNSGVIPPGQYTFPYSFSLPINIPGSFFQKRWCLLGEIAYYIEAVLDPPLKSIINKKGKGIKLNYKCKINIVQPKKNGNEYIKLEAKVNMFCLGCVPKGQSKIHIAFGKDTYLPGEIARAQLEIDNRNANYKCTKLTFVLRQTLTLITPNAQISKTYPITSASTYGVNAKSLSDTTQIELKLPPPEQMKNFEYKGKELAQLLYTEPENIHYSNPSTIGKLIISAHTLNVVCEYQGFLKSRIIKELNIPVIIQSIPEENQINVEAPEGWKPQIMEVQDIIPNYRSSYSGIRGEKDDRQISNRNNLNGEFYLAENNIEEMNLHLEGMQRNSSAMKINQKEEIEESKLKEVNHANTMNNPNLTNNEQSNKKEECIVVISPQLDDVQHAIALQNREKMTFNKENRVSNSNEKNKI